MSHNIDLGASYSKHSTSKFLCLNFPARFRNVVLARVMGASRSVAVVIEQPSQGCSDIGGRPPLKHLAKLPRSHIPRKLVQITDRKRQTCRNIFEELARVGISIALGSIMNGDDAYICIAGIAHQFVLMHGVENMNASMSG